MRRAGDRVGFVLFEQILALMVFAIVGVSLVTALNEIGRLAAEARHEAIMARLLDSELRKAMSLPQLEEFEETVSLEELDVEMTTSVKEMTEGNDFVPMENEEGELLSKMWEIRVEARWWQGDDWETREAQTWRYGSLYGQ